MPRKLCYYKCTLPAYCDADARNMYLPVMPIAHAPNFPIDKLCTTYYITLLIAVANEHPLVGTSEIYAV